FAGVDVRHDADIPGAFEGKLTLGHGQFTSVFRFEISRGSGSSGLFPESHTHEGSSVSVRRRNNR
ncbi:MAG: hypothetical protein O3B90_13830, partial [Actinomycetota bacterium]|nr:hypothetical protein [Actinomycetota bacterium]